LNPRSGYYILNRKFFRQVMEIPRWQRCAHEAEFEGRKNLYYTCSFQEIPRWRFGMTLGVGCQGERSGDSLKNSSCDNCPTNRHFFPLFDP